MDIKAHKELADIVRSLDISGFKEDTTFRIDFDMPSGTDWRVYTYDTERVMRVVYVSDACEVIAKDSFLTEGNGSREDAIKDLLREYSDHASRVEKINNTHDNIKVKFASMAVPGVLFAFPAKMLGLFGGAGIGYLVNLGVQGFRVEQEDRNMARYLKDRKLYIGDSALNYIDRGF
jgi:hypothetical protein